MHKNRVRGHTKEKSNIIKKKRKENTHNKRGLGSAGPYKSQPKSISKTAPNVQLASK